MEPDHCSVIAELVLRYPELTIVGNAKTAQMIKQFYSFDVDKHMHLVKDGDTLSTGRHTFAFVFAPMVDSSSQQMLSVHSEHLLEISMLMRLSSTGSGLMMHAAII